MKNIQYQKSVDEYNFVPEVKHSVRIWKGGNHVIFLLLWFQELR